MTSEIRVNKLTNRVGLGTVEYTNTGIVVSGISTSDNFKTGTSNLHSTGLNVQDLDVDGHTNLDNVSIAGVVTATSFATDGGHMYITNAMPALYFTDTNNNPDWRIQNVNGTLSFIDATNSVHRIEINTVGNVSFSNDLDVDGHTNLDNVSIAGIVTATSFVGALTGTASGNPTLSNGADNRIITATGANALTGETNLTWTGNVFETNGGVENWTMRARSTGPSSRIGFQNQYLTNGYTIGCGAANQSFVVYTGGNNDRLRIDSTGITTFSQNVFFNKDIDVDGHTNLDNVSIAGVVTATSYIGDGSSLSNLPAGAPVGGASTNTVFFENDVAVAVNYQVTTNKNAMSAGPIAINAGIAVTVPSGSSWTIV